MYCNVLQYFCFQKHIFAAGECLSIKYVFAINIFSPYFLVNQIQGSTHLLPPLFSENYLSLCICLVWHHENISTSSEIAAAYLMTC